MSQQKNQIQVTDLPYSVSIVIPNYNQGHLIHRAIESAAMQSYKNKEVVIVDDGSTDNSVEIIKRLIDEYKHLCKFTFIPKNNGGTASARNAGIKATKSNFVAFLDADDYYYPHKVAISIGKCIEYPGIGVVYSDYDIRGKDGIIRREFKESFDFNKLIQRCIVSTNSIVARTCFDKVGLFNESIKGMEDYEMWLRIATKFMLVHIPLSLFEYHEHGGNKTLTANLAEWMEEERQMKTAFLKNHGFIQ